MRVLIVSGIWPPEVGGPASHAPELGEFLAARGHEVRAVASVGPAAPERPSGFPLRTTRRERPLPLRIAAGAGTIGAAARGVDVVYAAGMYSRSALAAAAQRVPLVVKLGSDPAYERAQSLRLYDGPIEGFEAAPGRRLDALRRLRRTALGSAARVVIPSRHVAGVAAAWGVPAERIVVIPNPAPELNGAAGDRDELRRRLGVEGPTIVFSGRLVEAKNVPLAVAALARLPGARLAIVGEGPEEGAIRAAIDSAGVADRVRLVGAVPRDDAVAWLRAADVAVLPSDRENFPHMAVEALAAGTPLVGTAVGGTPEIVTSGVDGLLVERGDERGLAEALGAVVADAGLRDRLRAGGARTVERYRGDRLLGEIEELLAATAARGR